MTQRVKCKIRKTIWARHKAGRYDVTSATCSICNNVTKSYGSGDRSVTRCLALLKETCPMGAIHFYIADTIQENRKFRNTTSTHTYKNGKELIDNSIEKKTVLYPSDNNLKRLNNSPSSEIIYVRAIRKNTRYSKPFVVHRSSNQSQLPNQFVLSVSMASNETDIIQNNELNLFAEYKSGFLDNTLEGFRIANSHGYYIVVEEIKHEQYNLYKCDNEELNQSSTHSATESRWVKIAKENPEFIVVLLSKYYPLGEDIIEQYTEKLGWKDWPGLEEVCKLEEQDKYPLDDEFFSPLDEILFFEPDLLSSNKSLLWSESFIERFSHKWDWRWLSMNEALPWTESLIERFKDKWVWKWLSANTSLPWSDSFVERYANKWYWPVLSGNTGLPWSENFILRYADKWDWLPIDMGHSVKGYGYLAKNPMIPWSENLFDYIEDAWFCNGYIGWILLDNPNIPWPQKWIEREANEEISLKYYSKNTTLPWSVSFINRYADQLDWKGLSENISLPWSVFLINGYAGNWDWNGLSENSALPWSETLIERYADKWDWNGLSTNSALPWSETLIELYADKWNWNGLSTNSALPWSETLIELYADKWNWNGLSTNSALPWSETLIERYADKWDWNGLSTSSALPWSETLIELYADKWDWNGLSTNSALPWSETLIELYDEKWNWISLSNNSSVPWSESLIEYYASELHIPSFEKNENIFLEKLIKKIEKKVITEIMNVLPKKTQNNRF